MHLKLLSFQKFIIVFSGSLIRWISVCVYCIMVCGVNNIFPTRNFPEPLHLFCCFPATFLSFDVPGCSLGIIVTAIVAFEEVLPYFNPHEKPIKVAKYTTTATLPWRKKKCCRLVLVSRQSRLVRQDLQFLVVGKVFSCTLKRLH